MTLENGLLRPLVWRQSAWCCVGCVEKLGFQREGILREFYCRDGIYNDQVRQVMEAWGNGPEVYGLIHADMAVDANLLFWRGSPRVIDFESSGFGCWIFDLAVALEHVWDDPSFPQYRHALLDGYAEYRSLPGQQLTRLELFIAAVCIYWELWAVGGTHVHPEYLDGYRQRIDREAALVMRYANTN